MTPDRHIMLMIALCAVAGAMVLLMASGTVQPLIPILS